MTGAAVLMAAVAVAIPGKYFAPAQVTVVAGDEVSWRNSDLDNHDVRAVDGSFDSGPLGRFGGSYTARFDVVGPQPYYCTIHPFMRGSVDVVGATLGGPAGAVLAGERVRLDGRAPAGAEVWLERRTAAGWAPVGRAAAAGDGAFAFSVMAAEGAVYRATTAAGASPELALAVTASVDMKVAVHRGRVTVRTDPAQPGLLAVLQRYSKERYMWRRVAHARLSRRGRADFTASGRGRVRVTIGRTLRGTPLATSAVVRLRDGHVVRDPAMPPPPGHDSPSPTAPGHP
jgi:plastocyanin